MVEILICDQWPKYPGGQWSLFVIAAICDKIYLFLIYLENVNLVGLIIDQSNKSQSVPVLYPTMHHSEQKCAISVYVVGS